MRTLHIILFLFLALNIPAQQLYVVSVGICNYKDPHINDLRFAEADVASFNKVTKVSHPLYWGWETLVNYFSNLGFHLAYIRYSFA